MNLRRAIPSVIEPLTLLHTTPEDLYSVFSQKATVTGKEIRAFTDAYNDPAYREYLEMAKKSKTSDADGIRPWLISEHPDWMEVKKEEVEEEMGMKSSISGATTGLAVPQDVNLIMERFHEQYEGIDIAHTESANSDKFQVRALTDS